MTGVVYMSRKNDGFGLYFLIVLWELKIYTKFIYKEVNLYAGNSINTRNAAL